MRLLCSTLFLALAPGLALANDVTTLVDFESGTLGWSGPGGPGGASGIVSDGGNGGGAGFQTVFNDFGITFRNDSPAFTGDFTQFDSVTLSVDVLVNNISFGSFGQVPRPFLVELRDFDSAQGGYPWTSVWYLFGDISEGPNWNTYSVTIDDPNSATLPPGWGGYGDETPLAEPILPAGITFADVLAGVDQVVYTTLQPGFFFGFTDHDVVLDNISIATTGGAWCEYGTGLAGAEGVPALDGYGDMSPGSTVVLSLTNLEPNAVAFLAVGNSEVALPFFGGTLLTSGDVTIVQGAANGNGHFPSSFTWPTNVPQGASYYWQYGILDASAPEGVALSNGLVSTTP